MVCNRVLILYPHSNKHLGLWDDLAYDERVELLCSEKKKYKGIRAFLQRLYFKFFKIMGYLPLHHWWYEYKGLYSVIRRVDHLVVIDGALNDVELYELESCRKKKTNLSISLYLINAINANSPTMLKVRPKIGLFKWNNIFSFDAMDSQMYGYIFAGFQYYSKHTLTQERCPKYDVHFVGGVKGGRESLINDTFIFLKKNDLKCDFNLMIVDGEICERRIDGITYFSGGWKPYEQMLNRVADCKCILEICQQGQSGATLRYFEAVCYNKKLLTNNAYVKKFPFYDSRYIRVFETPEDIDLDWLNEENEVDYGYNFEFSPTHFVDFILERDNYEKI